MTRLAKEILAIIAKKKAVSAEIDYEAGAVYLYFQKGARVARTIEVGDTSTVDLDQNGEVIGLEVFGHEDFIELAKLHQRRSGPRAGHGVRRPGVRIPTSELETA